MNEVQLSKTSISKDVLTKDQMESFSRALAIVDRNPIINWVEGDPNHNEDFCLIRGSIEITRNFALKLAHLCAFNLHIKAPQFLPTGVCIVGRIWNEKQEIEEAGACDFAEIKGKRKLHDATARATTRMLKRAIEVIVGMPFLNLLIKELFGGFGTTGDPAEKQEERNVTPDPETEIIEEGTKEISELRWVKRSPVQCQKTICYIREALNEAVEKELLSKGEAEIWWTRVKSNNDKYSVLNNLYAGIVEKTGLDMQSKEKKDG